MKNSKNIVEVSEFQRFQNSIKDLTGQSAASKGLIIASIEDLKSVNAEMVLRSNAISELIVKLEGQRSELEKFMFQNTELIEKLQAAFAE